MSTLDVREVQFMLACVYSMYIRMYIARAKKLIILALKKESCLVVDKQLAKVDEYQSRPTYPPHRNNPSGFSLPEEKKKI